MEMRRPVILRPKPTFDAFNLKALHFSHAYLFKVYNPIGLLSIAPQLKCPFSG
jgi:hypothetical protein